MLDGGVIPRRPYLIVGPSGSGKTTLALQFLCDGVRRGERCLLVTLEEPPNEARLNHRGLGGDFDRVEVFDAIPDVMRYERVPFKDISAVRASMPFGHVPFVIRRTPELTGVEVTITALEQMLRSEVTRRGFTRVVIDSLTALEYFCMKGYNEVAGAQTFLRFLSDLQVTTFLTVESPIEDADTTERVLARGEIRLFRWEHENATVRAIGVEKFRGSSHDIRLHPYRIGPQGVDINLSVTISRDTRQIIQGEAALAVSKYAGRPLDPLLDEIRDLVAIGADVGPIRSEVEAALDAVRQGNEPQVAGHVSAATALAMDLASAYRRAPAPDASKRTPDASAALMRVVGRASEARTGIAPTQLPPSAELERQLESLLEILPAARPAVPPPPKEPVPVASVPPPVPAALSAAPPPPTRKGVPRAVKPPPSTPPVAPVIEAPTVPAPAPGLSPTFVAAPPTPPPPAPAPPPRSEPPAEVPPPITPQPARPSPLGPAETPPPPLAGVMPPLPPEVAGPPAAPAPLSEPTRASAPEPHRTAETPAPAVAAQPPPPPVAAPKPEMPVPAPAAAAIPPPPPPPPSASVPMPPSPPASPPPAARAKPVTQPPAPPVSASPRPPLPTEPPAMPSGLGRSAGRPGASATGGRVAPPPHAGIRDLASPGPRPSSARTPPPPLPSRAPPEAPAPSAPAAPAPPEATIPVEASPAPLVPIPPPSEPVPTAPPPTEAPVVAAKKPRAKRAPRVPRKVEPKPPEQLPATETAPALPSDGGAPELAPSAAPAPPKARKRAVRKKKAPSVISATEGPTPPAVAPTPESDSPVVEPAPEKPTE
jgi:KaiC/GvpD/RAD55 family RecA-like ATPase